METNVSFKSNVNIIKSKSTLNGDEEFLKKVTDYYALYKLMMGPCGGSTNSSYYVFKVSQRKILAQRPDSAINENNKLIDLAYGYSERNEEDLYPLIGELVLQYGKSIWSKGDYWWSPKSFYGEGKNQKIGHWVEVAKQKGTVELFGGGTHFTSYVKEEIRRANIENRTTVPVGTVAFDELYEPDPYYYLYQETAGVKKEHNSGVPVNEEAEVYLQTYGIYSAFELVEQKTVIEASADKNIFVDAGPGTGKTYTLIEKINYMVEELGVEPSGIMVLCFSRAAVAEIKKRREAYVEAGGSRALRDVDIRTFHSFAWWLINEANNSLTEEGWKPLAMSSLSYDACIVRATGIIRRFTDEVLGGWEHFVVDEIQDLTDVRARLVLEIVRGCLKVGCGLTVFGDSCQAIYDYKQEGEVNPMSSDRFYRELFNALYKKASFYKFGFNHRQTDKLKLLTVDLREAILNEKLPRMTNATKMLYARLLDASRGYLSDVTAPRVLSAVAGEGKVCLLCRNNGQVLRLSAALRKRGTNHIVNAYDRTGAYAAWVGRVFSGFKSVKITKDAFIERFGVDSDHMTTGEEVWNTIAHMLRKEDNNSLGVSEILSTIYSSAVEDPVFHNIYDSNVIVSNIHKAKGREYEAVIIEENFLKRLTGNYRKNIGEFKTLYVAATRPRQKLYTAQMVPGDNVRFMKIFKTGRNRWVKFVNRDLRFVEIQGNTDIDVNSFNMLGSEIQDYIAASVRMGDEIVLKKSKAGEVFRYNIVHVVNDRHTVIGYCAPAFYRDLECLLETSDNQQWPTEIRDLYVSDIFTNIDRAIAEEETDNIGGKIWNWVDFCGLGRLVFDIY